MLLSHIFDYLQKDITLICLKDKELKSKTSPLSKEIEILQSKDEQYKLDEQI